MPSIDIKPVPTGLADDMASTYGLEAGHKVSKMAWKAYLHEQFSRKMEHCAFLLARKNKTADLTGSFYP